MLERQLQQVERLNLLDFPRLRKSRGKCVVIDDDPVFRQIFSAIAKFRGIDHELYGSLNEMGRFGKLGDYDLIVLDYQLPALTGLEIAEYVDIFFKGLPVILISSTEFDYDTTRLWPRCIMDFKSKKEGIAAIVDAADRVMFDY